MANATAKGPITTVRWGNDTIKRPCAATATTYFPGTLIALDASGNAVHCDNTAGIRFDGICASSQREVVFSGDAAGDRTITVERPFRFMAPIAAAVAGDEGKAVYAAFDNAVAYSTTNSIFVGWVDQVVSATAVLIRPAWSGQATVAGTAFDGSTLTFTGSGTGTMSVVVPDNLADALSFKEGSNSYLTLVTTNSGETVKVTPLLTLVAGAAFTGATTANVLTLVDNLADALNIKEGANSYLKFVTTNSGEKIVPGKDIVSLAGLLSAAPTGSGIGYSTGAGGAVSQATDRTTGVTVNTLCGLITTQATSLAAGAEVSFTVTNSTVAVGDTVIACIRSGPTTVGSTQVSVTTVAAGSFQLTLNNLHASVADTGAALVNFAVIKAVSA